jgi:nitroreductase
MDLSTVIKERRSIRQFKDEAVSREVLEEVLELATWAPSAMNGQKWKFFVVQGTQKDAFLEISASAFEAFKPLLEKNFKDKPKVIDGMKTFFETYGNAPVIVMAYAGKMPGGNDDDVYSVSMAVQNLMLAAREKGLGASWTDGVVFYKADEINALLGVDDMKLVCVVPLGYPAETPKAPPRKPGRVEWVGFE